MIYYQYSAIEKFRTTIKFDLYFRRVTFPPPILCCWVFRALSTRWMWNLKAISWGRSTSQVQGEQVKLRFTWPRGKQRRITNGRKIKPEICTIFNRFSYFFTAMKWLPLLLEPLQSKYDFFRFFLEVQNVFSLTVSRESGNFGNETAPAGKLGSYVQENLHGKATSVRLPYEIKIRIVQKSIWLQLIWDVFHGMTNGAV